MNYLNLISFRIKNFLKYILLSHSRRGHGIHSPFVFHVVSKVLRNKIDPDIVLSIENIRKKLIQDDKSIAVNDLGSGSVIFSNRIRKVSQITKVSPVSSKYGLLLANMALEFGRSTIIELGTSVGISTMYMASVSSSPEVFTIEGCSSTAEIARQNFESIGLRNIKIINKPFDEALQAFCNSRILPGLVFIDGDHKRDSVIRYFHKISEISDKSTVIIIDDINYSKEMNLAWEEIKKIKSVSATIDLYRMGIVFFRSGMSQKHYIIRY